jgi:hypothetical protein
MQGARAKSVVVETDNLIEQKIEVREKNIVRFVE